MNVPARYSRVDPWVISTDTESEIGFLEFVFQGRETPGSRMLGPDRRIDHVEVVIGDAVIMMFDADREWPVTPAHLRIYVADLQNTVDHAVEAGARVVTQPTELAFGERVARVRDPQGHLWWIHEHFEDVSPAEVAQKLVDPNAQHAMAYVQDSLADELLQVR